MNVMSLKTIIDVYEFEPYQLGRPPEAPFKSNTSSFFCAIVVLVINYAAAQKKTTVTGDITKEKGSGTRVDLGISHKRGNWKFDGSGFGTSRGHRGGKLGLLHKPKNMFHSL
jgi:hypothetical protein